jgi:rhamnulokinase
VLERLEELTGKRLEPLHIFGGGTQNRLLNQFSADVTALRGPRQTLGELTLALSLCWLLAH